ncbi:MAG: alpha/beta fold hydrolase [Lapillicoccus sp.]
MTHVEQGDAPPLSLARAWGGEGHLVHLAGVAAPVHYVDFGGPGSPVGEAPVVLVHGLGGSHLNWVLLAPLLRSRRRVYALDLAGFGLTPGGGQAASVDDNAELLTAFLRQVVGRPCVLVGNSMGGLVSILLASAHPELVERLVLLDPAIPTRRRAMDRRVAGTFLIYRIPRVGELFTRSVSTRMTDERRVRDTTALCFADPTRADAQVLAAGVALLKHRRRHAADADASYLEAARSILRSLGRRGRLPAAMASVTAPVLLVHGDRDRLVPVEAARSAAAEHPDWTCVILAGIGHTPMLETPTEVARLIDEWLGQPG